jgi:tricorn protease
MLEAGIPITSLATFTRVSGHANDVLPNSESNTPRLLKAPTMLRAINLAAALFFLLSATQITASDTIQLASAPALSADGQTLAFSWGGEIWTVPTAGRAATRLTSSPSREDDPKFSPDGKSIAFTSDRAGSTQVFVVDVAGGQPTQLTFHSEGCSLDDWFPDGKSLLINASRDHFWRRPERFYRISSTERAAEELLFDAYGSVGQLSPDGTQLLFTREGERWWRQGYRGSRTSQIWTADLKTGAFTEIIKHPTESRSPLWQADGKGFFYVSAQSGSRNLWQRNLEDDQERQLTTFDKDLVLWPCISRDGSTIVFRHLANFYRLATDGDGKPQKITITADVDRVKKQILRRTLTSATDVGFTSDGLEIAFIAGGDVWVMDTELREPRQVTNTPEEEREPVFSPDGKTIVFLSDAGGQSDIWQATRGDEDKYWWQNDAFKLEALTKTAEVEGNLQWSPAGDLIGFVRERGDMWVMKPDGKEARRLFRSWNTPDYDWSPDGKWLVYALSDNEFNRDIFVLPLDGSREAFNLSRHPDNDGTPSWSPDGKMIAFTGRRLGTEVDIYYVFLQAKASEETSRDRKLVKAIEKLQKARKNKPTEKTESTKKKGDDEAEKKDDASDAKPATVAAEADAAGKESSAKDNANSKLPEVTIDFNRIHERLRRVSIADTREGGLFWSHDSKKLAFTASVDGKRGTYTISPPEDVKPKLLTTQTGSNPVWLSKGNQVVWLGSGTPASVTESGKVSSYGFSAPQTVDIAARNQAAFDQCWQAMRDHFYDGTLNHRNWDAIRRKYQPLVAQAVDRNMFSEIVNLMLGELNGSHMGFSGSRGGSSNNDDDWRETTAHLGVRFDNDHQGPGWRIKDVIPDSPADKVASKLVAGETILSIDGKNVDPALDVTTVLNGRSGRNILLRIRNSEGEDRDVNIRPISYSAARSLLYEMWIDDNQRRVEEASAGKLGYMHIRGMNMSSFYRFERELYAVGAGKDGIVIDVRENGGGSTTDHLLTVLTQPAHAITVPRGGGMGYPQDRSVYATWRKPIVVLCNQNSYSNAEIFSHAIKTLKRGKLVGVTTAGGVISTGGRRIMDVGFLRMPFRGWYVMGTGADMELNGAVPHYEIWPTPGDLPAGKDEQLDKAIKVLGKEVKKWHKRPQPVLKKASER